MLAVETPVCAMCGKSGIVMVPEHEYRDWKAGALAQNALRSLSTDDREQLMTGTHPACWDLMTEGLE